MECVHWKPWRSPAYSSLWMTEAENEKVLLCNNELIWLRLFYMSVKKDKSFSTANILKQSTFLLFSKGKNLKVKKSSAKCHAFQRKFITIYILTLLNQTVFTVRQQRNFLCESKLNSMKSSDFTDHYFDCSLFLLWHSWFKREGGKKPVWLAHFFSNQGDFKEVCAPCI